MRGFGLALLLCVLACANDAFGPGIYIVQFTPPPEWRDIYLQVEQCAGLPEGQFGGIRWYWVQTGGGPWQGQDGNTYGMWRPGRKIYLIQGDTTYLRHEMLHDILWESGWRPPAVDSTTQADLHPVPPFYVCTGGR